MQEVWYIGVWKFSGRPTILIHNYKINSFSNIFPDGKSKGFMHMHVDLKHALLF